MSQYCYRKINATENSMLQKTVRLWIIFFVQALTENSRKQHATDCGLCYQFFVQTLFSKLDNFQKTACFQKTAEK
jgi:hypothetical protein